MNKKAIIDAYARIRTIDNTIPDDVLDFMKNSAITMLENEDGYEKQIAKGIADLQNKRIALLAKYTDQLNSMKETRSRWQEEKWSDADIQECDRLIERTAEFIRDLKDNLVPDNKAAVEAQQADMRKGIEYLMANYSGRLKELSERMATTKNNGSVNDIQRTERFNTKQSEYLEFIKELKSLLETQPA